MTATPALRVAVAETSTEQDRDRVANIDIISRLAIMRGKPTCRAMRRLIFWISRCLRGQVSRMSKFNVREVIVWSVYGVAGWPVSDNRRVARECPTISALQSSCKIRREGLSTRISDYVSADLAKMQVFGLFFTFGSHPTLLDDLTTR